MRRRVIATRLPDWVDPAACFSALCRGSEPAFWLDSGVGAVEGVSCLGVGSRVVTTTPGGGLADWPSGDVHDESMFEFLGREQAVGIDDDDGARFPLGWIGWLGYELHEETLGAHVGRASRYPDAAFLFADRAIVFDHAKREVSLVALGDSWSGELAEWRYDTVCVLAECRRASEAPAAQPAPHAARGARGLLSPPPLPPSTLPQPTLAYSDDDYLAMIEACQRSIHAGDAYQLCLTTEVRLDVHPDPVDTYLLVRESSPSHHGGFLRIGDVSVLSSSPERFLSVSATGVVESKPIKGTRRRGSTPVEDAALREELLDSEKERAENLMIVDLVRNDLSRVCEVGSVTVARLR